MILLITWEENKVYEKNRLESCYATPMRGGNISMGIADLKEEHVVPLITNRIISRRKRHDLCGGAKLTSCIILEEENEVKAFCGQGSAIAFCDDIGVIILLRIIPISKFLSSKSQKERPTYTRKMRICFHVPQRMYIELVPVFT